MAAASDGKGSDSRGKKRNTWFHNGIELTKEPYPWKGKTLFCVGTGGGLESVFVEEYSTVWARYQGKDYRMVAGVDDRWREMLAANNKNMGVGSTGTDIDDAMRSTTSDEEVKPRDDEVDPPNKKKARKRRQRDVEAQSTNMSKKKAKKKLQRDVEDQRRAEARDHGHRRAD